MSRNQSYTESLRCGVLAELLGKKAKDRRHLRQRISCQGKIAMGSVQSVPDPHSLKVDRQHAVFNGMVARSLPEKIGEDAVIILQSRVDTVERGGPRRSL